MRHLALLPLALASCTPAHAHDAWSNGAPVPAWVKGACCGPDDVHRLTPDQVHARPDGWHVEGYPDVLPYGKELPSEDGAYWIFYRVNRNPADAKDTTFSPVYCFFAPPRSF